MLDYLQCDVGANKNAGQAFSMPRLSSHWRESNISVFRLSSIYLLLFSTNFGKITVKELGEMPVQLAKKREIQRGDNGVKGFYN